MATDAPADLVLTPLTGEARTLTEQLTTFHLAAVVLDPFTNESAWLIDSAGRLLETFTGADVRVAFVVTGTAAEAREFLGPWVDKIFTFADPDRTLVKGLGLEHLPAFVHIGQDGTTNGAAEGWDPAEWRDVAEHLAKIMSWSRPNIPAPGDPAPYGGSPALG
ncbi:MAG TPA: hypothetical protein VMW08_01225 [Acidimicrobiales bacterium]|nr:hypothetical protein [Acidimicrobiales bacterium]